MITNKFLEFKLWIVSEKYQIPPNENRCLMIGAILLFGKGKGKDKQNKLKHGIKSNYIF